MMKLSIKIDPETLFLLHRVTMDKAQSFGLEKVEKSLCLELFEIHCRLCFSYSQNPNGKLRTLTLRYHLADKLLQLVKSTLDKPLGSFEYNKLDMFKNQLHQKLL